LIEEQVDPTYELPMELSRFSAHPVEAIKSCMVDHSRIPVVIENDQTMVGFFILHGWKGVQAYHSNQKAILLRAFSIDAKQQGKGFASQGMIQLPAFIKKHFPDRDEIILAVNVKNDIAQHLYRKSGFQDHGIVIDGRQGPMNILHYSLT